ncbi:putative PHD type zinc finger protein with BAH domain-containing protein [Yamadazyma tenuis]|uniref:BAH-domain-containing protein n=1 Tax=Candida tenuis (strain ATCC 10573 / BCRC 21748 / CBS 615 / JCM 9827 / NBRC 10315 / NRRL Y-1498 / VKM Y-70) TaxID=590646 RepID=G3B324_CANTC|nr:uncharacterized protein CANTEDRAFT_93573 [Yamadazyma tenuis ATCC 10573]EGV64063.1 hypothetical protein CANTEDRAFT_93573 [Yamadazyma tenuis ATCC 10573]WEJ96307.1 putative PHD type zinc finger protein with BAH domain-containing protein [Yamadazyma tenuis]
MSRPKRQATINKSYTDTIDESVFHERVKKPRPAAPMSDKPSKSTRDSTSPSVGLGADKPISPPPGKNSTPATATVTIVPTAPASSSQERVNWQPVPQPIDYFSCKLNLHNSHIDLDTKTLVCPAQPVLEHQYSAMPKQSKKFRLQKGDFIYMISEPPGEPYYIGRIMGFKPKPKPGATPPQTGIVPEVSVRDFEFQVQWFYRPRDISKPSPDSRLLFASMHTDTCPLHSFRGLVDVRHKQDIENLDDFIKRPNSFFFDKLYDRYMMKFYDVISTLYLLKISNNDKSAHFLTALNKRFDYIFIESQMTKFLINGFQSGSCTCENCGQWCSTQDSVTCADCDQFFHLYCLDPPLLKKPSRGFSWHCESCTKKHLQQYKSTRILMLGSDNKSSNESELSDGMDIDTTDDPIDRSESERADVLPKYELMAIEFLKHDKLSLADRRLKEEWCMRYLGIHSKLEDAVDLDDRSFYPRAATRIGAKHQATHIPEFIDHPIVYYDAADASGKKKSKAKLVEGAPLPVPPAYGEVSTKEYPVWLQPRPKGYIERGVDDGDCATVHKTCTLLWKPMEEDVDDNFGKLDQYVAQCAPIADKLGLSPNSPNFMDSILNNYFKHQGDYLKAMDDSMKITKKSLHEPILTAKEIQKFEEGVKKYGSELYPIYKMVKTVPCASIVRFYYLWKKSENGRLIWGNFEGRIKKKLQNLQNESKDSKSKPQFFNEDDDSCYDLAKAEHKTFVCKYCSTTSSTQWFRITGHDNASSIELTGLCFRCARLWRRYAVIWEDPIEVERKINKNGKRKIEYELLRDADAILIHTTGSPGLFVEEKKKEKSRKRPSPSPQSDTPKKRNVKKKPEVEVNKEDGKKKKPEKKPVKKPEPKVKEETPEPEKEPFEHEHIISPIVSKDYKIPEQLKLMLTSKPDNIDDKKVSDLLQSFKIKQLCDLANLINHETSPPGLQAHQQCSVCSDSSEDDLLQCGKCLIAVHSWCVGITVPAAVKPIKEWLCECCVNELNPIFQQQYKCCLCTTPGGFLKPIQDSGKWCHILCAFSNYQSVEFKPVAQLNQINPKKYLTAIMNSDDSRAKAKMTVELITNTFEIRNVDMVLLKSRIPCSVCHKTGAISNCHDCDKPLHINCNSNLGFKLVAGESKVKVDGKTGKLEPVLYCSDHLPPSSIHSIAYQGKRSYSSKEPHPLIKLFTEDILKSSSHKNNGNYLKATRYLELVRGHLSEEKQEELEESSYTCAKCDTRMSPIWRDSDDKKICQTCYHNNRSSEEDSVREPSTDTEGFTADEFLHVINEPISGEQFGILDHHDKVTKVHVPLSLGDFVP